MTKQKKKKKKKKKKEEEEREEEVRIGRMVHDMNGIGSKQSHARDYDKAWSLPSAPS